MSWGLLKVDVLALGMLTCISKAFKLVEERARRDGETERRSRRKDIREWQKVIARFEIDGVAEGDGSGRDWSIERQRRMPKAEQFGLTNQMRRAAVSIPSNIAEGLWTTEPAGLDLKFLRIARGSLDELSTQFELAYEMQHDQPAVHRFCR